jgi:hypothetical protein
MSNGHHSHPGGGDDPVEAAEAVVAMNLDRMVALAARRRRLLAALHDLGLLPVVGSSWVTLTGDGFAFADLADRASDQLVRALEDIAADRPGSPRPCPPVFDVPLFTQVVPVVAAALPAPSAN